MSIKPSYEELSQMVDDLKKELARKNGKSKGILKNGDGKKLKAILESIDDHMSLVDRDLNILWANKAAKRVFGRNIIGMKCYTAYRGRKEPCQPYPCVALKAFRSGKSHKQCSEMTDKEGKPVYYFSTASVAMTGEDGLPTAVIKISKNITESKLAGLELEDSMQKLRTALDNTIKAMALTVESRDLYTAGHQRRATNIARAIAQEMNLSQDQVDGIRMAGVIHDLGKISIPAEILSKPGKISDTEFSMIKEHPQRGYEILKGIDFQWPIADIVRQHHERINGSGYPQGLIGDKILLEARVIMVADVIEAMASHRPYRASLGIEAAIDEITRNQGVLYDSDVVDASVNLYQSGFQFN